jgi:ParB family chromosome partitioning protein
MTDVTSIPLNKLVAWDGNVRKTAGADAALHELAASIAAHGLLQSLVVRKHKKGKFAVVAGARRLVALQLLAESGRIKPDYVVACQVLGNEVDAAEISLVENTLREAMHPADEFEAFRALVDSGTSEADVAARFGVTEAVVSKRLKLARVSPMIIAAYRRDEVSLAQVMAFAVSDDHTAQERVFENLSDRNHEPDDIRDALTEHEIAATDRRVRFVTLAAYEQAGGGVRRDLFCEDDSGIFILDTALLDRLVAQKLDTQAAAVRAEGWKWVEIRPSFDYADWSGYGRRHEQSVPFSAEEQAEYDKLVAEYDAIYDQDHDLTEEQQARCDEITARCGELEDREFWPPETLAIAGAPVSINDSGAVDVRRGYVAPEDAAALRTVEADDADGGASDGDEPAVPVSSLPHTLTESLTTHRTAALAAALSQQPKIALAAVVHAMALQCFHSYVHESCLEISLQDVSLKLAEGSKARQLLETGADTWYERLPADADGLWAWCLAQSQDRLLDLLAFCAAYKVNAVQRKADRADSSRFLHAQALADALSLDMKEWFTPTAENYFSKVTKDGIVEALKEARDGAVAPAWLKAKKSDLASPSAIVSSTSLPSSRSMVLALVLNFAIAGPKGRKSLTIVWSTSTLRSARNKMRFLRPAFHSRQMI